MSCHARSRRSSCTDRWIPTSVAASSRSICRRSTPTTSRRCSTVSASRCVPVTTARCRSTSASISPPPHARASASTRRPKTSTGSQPGSTRSGRSSTGRSPLSPAADTDCGIPRDALYVVSRQDRRVTLRRHGRGQILKSKTSKSIRVGLVDDHAVVLASLAREIEDADDLDLIGVAANIADAVELASRVDVLVCDMNLADGAEGLRVLREIHDPRTPRQGDPPAVLFLSGFAYPSLIRAALDGGASGYLDKSADLPEIVDAVRTLAVGGTAYSAVALHTSRDARRRPSDREIQVLDLIVEGATNAEVGAALGLSEKTVGSHLRRLFDRYGLLSRTELAVLAIDEGWVAARRVKP